MSTELCMTKKEEWSEYTHVMIIFYFKLEIKNKEDKIVKNIYNVFVIVKKLYTFAFFLIFF